MNYEPSRGGSRGGRCWLQVLGSWFLVLGSWLLVLGLVGNWGLDESDCR